MAVRLLVVGSPAARRDLVRALGSSVQVVGESEPRDLVSAAGRIRPDLLVLDDSPDALGAVAAVMRARPTRVLVVGDPSDRTLAQRAVLAGALDATGRLPGPTDPRYQSERQRVLRLMEALATVPLVRRTLPVPEKPQVSSLLLIGASTGGPQALEVLLRTLPRPYPLPIVLVQHVVPGFDRTLAEWLTTTTGHAVRVPSTHVTPGPGEVLLAPSEAHLVMRRGGMVAIQPGEPHHFHRPSVDLLFESAAAHCAPTTIAVLLTGMGSDGALGLLALRRAGACTVAQLPSTCVVDSMPRSAIEAGAASEVLPIEGIAALLSRRVAAGARSAAAG